MIRSFMRVNVFERTFLHLFRRAELFKTGSDYMPFFADLGIPSMDFRFTFDAVSSTETFSCTLIRYLGFHVFL